MTTELDRRLNQWFDTVEPKQIPSSILPVVFDEVGRIGQRRMPWHRFAASMELAWSRRSPLSPTFVMVILAALLLITVAAMAVAGGLVHIPRPHTVTDGLIAVEEALDNPDTSVGNTDQQIRFIDLKTGVEYSTPHEASRCGAHFSPDGSRYVLLYQDPDQMGTGVVNIGVANSDPQEDQPSFLFRKEAQSVFDASWAPDGSAIVTAIEPASPDQLGGRLWVLPTDGSAARMLTDVPTSYWASWSATGKWIAFVGVGLDHPLYVIRPDGTDLRTLRDSGVGPVAWSPTTDQLAYSGDDGQLHVVNPDGVERIAMPYRVVDQNAEQDAEPAAPVWSPDGTHIAVAVEQFLSTPRDLKVFDVSTGSMSTIPTSVPVGQVDWSADSQRLVAIDDAGTLLELSLDGSAPRLLSRHVRGMCMSASRALSWQKVTK